MKNSYLIAGAGVVAALAIAVTAQAKPGGIGHGPRGMERPAFAELDSNADGNLTPAEMQAHAKARFDAADTDGDGVLSVEEMTARMQARMSARAEKGIARMIERRDANGDGALSFDEVGPKDGKTRLFDRADTDGDGMISAEEYAELLTQRGGRKGMMGRKHGSE